MSIRVITFDLDDTLWDVKPALERAEAAQRAWLLRHRPRTLEAIGPEEHRELRKRVWRSNATLTHNVTAMRKLLLRELQLAAGYSSADAEAGANAAFASFIEERQRVELHANALTVLDVLARSCRLGALTNGNADVYKTDAGEYFEFALLAEEVGASKPAADMFLAALELTGVAADEVLHVGDSVEHDVLGALGVGMRAAWLNPEGHDWTHDARPDALIRSLDELPDLLKRL
ncbi:MAG: HAD-IA family hydrolase [Halieaceae bacterium]|jgi:putative hydrolase of the HAD superfamily|nr:HAD-IA family hydrolase [Halieaceae bacterium]